MRSSSSVGAALFPGGIEPSAKSSCEAWKVSRELRTEPPKARGVRGERGELGRTLGATRSHRRASGGNAAWVDLRHEERSNEAGWPRELSIG